MSEKDRKITQAIADIVYKISVDNKMNLEDSMRFVYNSETLSKLLTSSDDNTTFDALESSMLKELKYG